jgi:hypothetical protein
MRDSKVFDGKGGRPSYILYATLVDAQVASEVSPKQHEMNQIF